MEARKLYLINIKGKIEKILYVSIICRNFFYTDHIGLAASLQLWGLELFSCPPTTTLLEPQGL